MSEQQPAPRAPTGVPHDELADWATALTLVFVAGFGVLALVLLSRRRRRG